MEEGSLGGCRAGREGGGGGGEERGLLRYPPGVGEGREGDAEEE